MGKCIKFVILPRSQFKLTGVEDPKAWTGDAITTINIGMLDRTWENWIFD
jgi:hypothetical protein